ncbi:hypothetical protein EPUS_01241 [Endocarpon pusillum Z07020]|uniref:Non-haem dioxygenase N-terminal domain-containing protein n=1 Tax=Endocarpon pusillum (strain Z07020 / HMAS-L-300199) TaxID=1263415 RepID=U1HYD2_ENDPU|nr:uncharacterized protein EPUS_01241 [Endocarpon pusillum Z07020]ERF75875.1 hypothetical protein EPUS_01241 [Endocarpon pusillum Z07020]
MPIVVTPPEPTQFYVPTVDISPYLADPTSAEAGKIIADVRAACISTGFFQITGHGIPRSLQKDVFDAAAAYFALPYDEKKKLDAKTTIGHRGYDVLASQSYEADVLPDLKENPGLEVLDTNSNEFVPIAPNPDAYVVNVGSMLSKWTRNEYKSSVHRVINRNPGDRYSVVFFFDGNLDCRLSPLDGQGEKEGEEVLTVEGHMLKRMRESYGGKK